MIVTEAHKRLMLLAYVCILNAPIARIPGMPNIYTSVAVTLLPLAAGMGYDLFSRGKVHRVYWVGAAVLAIFYVAVLPR